MSHPLFLTSSILPRMPEGSRNEWRSFFDAGSELEANAFFPLFWLALFSAADLRRARFIDENDVDDEDSAIERQEILDSFDADATYPYLVARQQVGLVRLAARRESVIAAVGERYRPIFNAFESLIADGFADEYLLLRTSGLPDAADIEPWLLDQLGQLERLAEPAVIDGFTSDLSGYGADPIWQLTGAGASDVWPTPALAAQYAGRPSKTRSVQQPDAMPSRRHSHVHTQLDNVLEWMGALVAAGGALAAYAWTHSIGWALLAFFVVAGVAGFAIVKTTHSRRG